MEVVASLSQGRTAAAQCGLFTHKSVPVIFEPPCTRPVRKVSIHFEYLKNRSRCLDVSWQPVRGDLTAHP